MPSTVTGPVTVGTTECQRLEAEGGFRNWLAHNDGHGRVSLTRDEVVVDLRYSTATGRVTKATRTRPNGEVDHAAAVGKLGTVLRWFKDDR
ncbi:hypothetical protein [Nocardia wallacei]|uniref:hypothetical protein n=1 Tax=Nocardia wallacei TaxID=480035 RepID=UPI00245515D8|nr:hypothetical protein [Nocardia wallacei]